MLNLLGIIFAVVVFRKIGGWKMLLNIQKCSIHDGKGLRTLVFFKGCPLRCKWCANPESQDYEAEIMESQGKCIGCGACIKACKKGAIQTTEVGFKIDRNKCNRCFRCTDVCYAASKYMVGKNYEIDELYKHIEKDRIFYSIKGGGVTFSGGEPLTHAKYLSEIAKVCHERGIDVALESCGMGNYEEFKFALPYVNSMFIDIKHMDTETHKKLTGAGNELILENIKKIASHGIEITIRTPVIPGLNNSKENIMTTAKFIKNISAIKEYELLPYHQFGINKYVSLGRKYELGDIDPLSDSEMYKLVKCANDVFRNTDKVCFYTKDNEKIIAK